MNDDVSEPTIMMKKAVLILSLLSINSYSTTYENGEDRKTNRWQPYNSVSEVTIKNIYDKSKKSRVISLKSDDSRNGYILALERDSKSWCKTKGKSLKWSMLSRDDFVLLVSIQTINGHRYIIYTPSNERIGEGYYGLGKDSIDGKWHKYNRDLDLDLKRYEPDNEIIAVDTFFIRGKSIMVDDIEIESIKDIKKKHFKPQKPKECNIYIPPLNNIKEEKKLDNYDTVPPVIKLNGSSTVRVKLGDRYKELGAIAIDNVDGKLNVDISGDIDTNRVGTYTLFYMAKDRRGNTAMTTRIITVKGSSPHHQRLKRLERNRNRKNSKEKHHKKIDNQKIKDLELAMPPDDNSLQELGIID